MSADGKSEGVGSSEDDMDPSGRENDPPEIDPRAEDKELKYQLLKKYSGYFEQPQARVFQEKEEREAPKGGQAETAPLVGAALQVALPFSKISPIPY